MQTVSPITRKMGLRILQKRQRQTACEGHGRYPGVLSGRDSRNLKGISRSHIADYFLFHATLRLCEVALSGASKDYLLREARPWQNLNFRLLPQGQGAFRLALANRLCRSISSDASRIITLAGGRCAFSSSVISSIGWCT